MAFHSKQFQIAALDSTIHKQPPLVVSMTSKAYTSNVMSKFEEDSSNLFAPPAYIKSRRCRPRSSSAMNTTLFMVLSVTCYSESQISFHTNESQIGCLDTGTLPSLLDEHLK